MTDSDSHWLELPRLRLAPAREPRSAYLTMRDGVRIAVDVFEPVERSRRAPTIIRQTRYMRSLEPRRGGGWLLPELDLYARTRRAFLAAGYAWVDVDVRGTGASTGTWASPWFQDEIADGAEVIDWIVRQPWSNGRVGSLGISYDGTCADMLASMKHPALVAIAPIFALYDVFTDVAFPGGIHLSWFTERWAEYNAALDRNAFAEGMAIPLAIMGVSGRASPHPHPLERALGWAVRRGEREGRASIARVLSKLIEGVRKVDGERLVRDRSGNMDVHTIGKRVVYRDDTGLSEPHPEATVDTLSPHVRRTEVAASGVAIYSYSGWRDGAYPHSAIKRFHALPRDGSRLLLGPWIHTGRLHLSPFEPTRESRFDQSAELLSFFDEHLKNDHRGDGWPVHYFTMGDGWKRSRTWPPPTSKPQPFHLGAARQLSPEAPTTSSAHAIEEDGTTGTGVRARWRSLISLTPGDYLHTGPDRAVRDAHLLCYDTPPLDRATEVTGHPLAVLFVSCSAEDAHLFAYLEDVAPDGRVAYVTEGQLRLIHRRGGPKRTFTRADAEPMRPSEVAMIELDLLPISWRFAPRHRIRLALAGADRDHFDVMAPRTLHVHSSPEHPSRLVLPIVSGA